MVIRMIAGMFILVVTSCNQPPGEAGAVAVKKAKKNCVACKAPSRLAALANVQKK